MGFSRRSDDDGTVYLGVHLAGISSEMWDGFCLRRRSIQPRRRAMGFAHGRLVRRRAGQLLYGSIRPCASCLADLRARCGNPAPTCKYPLTIAYCVPKLGQMVRRMSAIAERSFLDQVIGREGLVEPDQLSRVLRVTKMELAAAS